MPVQGRSMWPLAAPWQVAVHAVEGELEIGDIIAVISESPQSVVLHRLRSMDGDRVILRGDTCDRPDAPLPRTAILGVLCAVKLGPIVVPVPRSGLIAGALRHSGLAWARVAPSLRAVGRRVLRAARNVDTRRRSGTV